MLPSEVLLTELVEPEWVVHSVLPRGNMVILAGEPGAGKSYLMYYLAYAIATNKPFLGYPTTPTKVLYFDEENGDPDFLKYNQWAWRAHGAPEPSTLDSTLRLEHFSLLHGWIGPMRLIMKVFKPGLVIVDTATPAFHLADENDNAEANRVISELRKIRQDACPGATVIVLKHEKQRDDVQHRRTIRGAKTWLGAFDQVLYHSKTRGAPKKDGTRRTVLEPDKLRAFGLRHPIGIDPCFESVDRKALILNPYSPKVESEE